MSKSSIRLLPTANDLLALPELDQEAKLQSLNTLMMAYRGLVEFRGEDKRPLLQPLLKLGSNVVKFIPSKTLGCDRELYWIPRWRFVSKTANATIRIYTPIEERGMVVDFEIENLAKTALKVTAGAKGCWAQISRLIYEAETLRWTRRAAQSRALEEKSLVLSAGDSVTRLALAIGASEDLDGMDVAKNKEAKPTAKFTGKKAFEFSAGQKGRLNWAVSKNLKVAGGGKIRFSIHLGLGLDEVSAVASIVEMKRQGGEKMLRRTCNWLSQRSRQLESPALSRLYNENLFFSLFFAGGICLDSEEFVSVTSRSPLYYVSAGYWDRDSLLWAFPAVLQADRKRARAMLDYAFGRQGRNIGVHSRFIDGAVLEPGFELDEHCAPVIALAEFIRVTGDERMAGDWQIRKRLRELENELKPWRHIRIDLYRTTSSPSDDFMSLPYLTYSNMLVWKFFHDLAFIYKKLGREKDSARAASRADSVRRAIREALTVKGQEGPMFAWSSDLEGNHTLGTEPPGCLQLLVHYGFCDGGDSLYRNTVAWLRSANNPHWYGGKAFGEMGCNHARGPWALGLANGLLSGKAALLRPMLESIPLDDGLACESHDAATGKPVTGRHFATAAGFLAYALNRSFSGKGVVKEQGKAQNPVSAGRKKSKR